MILEVAVLDVKEEPFPRVKDSVIFSIIENEWVGVREHLEFRLKSFEAKR